MRITVFFSAAILGLAAPVFVSAEEQAAAPSMETHEQKLGYLVGHQIGSQLKGQQFEGDFDSIVAGLRDALDGKKSIIPEARHNEIAAEDQRRQTAKREQAGAEAKAKGDAFLAENKQREGVKTTDSGLQYEVLKEGDGPKPKASETVKVHYTGTLIDGTVFDSSVERGTPATFGVGQVIPGWVEGLQLMPVGSKWKLFIPSDLAYGPNGAGGRIGPNEALIFEVELLGIE